MSKFLEAVEEHTPEKDIDAITSAKRAVQRILMKAGYKADAKVFRDDITLTLEDGTRVVLEVKDAIKPATEDNQGFARAATSKRNIDDAVGRIADKASSGVGGLVGKLVGASGQKAKKALKDREKVNRKAIPVYVKATKELEQALTKAAR